MGGLGLLPLLAALGIPASLGARRFARASAMVVTVGGDSVLHAERAGRPGLLTVTDSAFMRGAAALTEREADRSRRPRAEGAVTIGSCRTPMRPKATGRTQAEGWR